VSPTSVLGSTKKVYGQVITFDSQLKYQANYEDNALKIKGKCPEHVDPNYIESADPVIWGTRGMDIFAELRVLASDGTLSAGQDWLEIAHATEVIFAFTAVKAPEFSIAMAYEAIKNSHIRDYKSIYDKVELYLGEQPDIPTDQRLENLRRGEEDHGLYALFFQYGRYLLISSSRAGSLPANLQGIWNWEIRPPWGSNWTTNINTQMNYWHAQSCNLQECLQPYFDFVKRICEEGNKTARIHYNCRGFVHHNNADYWCNTNPAGLAHGEDRGRENSVTWAMWPMGGAWLTSELFRHYEYNLDQGFLRDTAGYWLVRLAQVAGSGSN
jgi:alpha-L-fucosidase 2